MKFQFGVIWYKLPEPEDLHAFLYMVVTGWGISMPGLPGQVVTQSHWVSPCQDYLGRQLCSHIGEAQEAP
jgi:hypothetical protein